MRVMSWNVAKRKKDLDKQSEKIKSIRPDILLLQEIYLENDRGQPESPWVDKLQKMGFWDEIGQTSELLFEKGREDGGANLIAVRNNNLTKKPVFENGEEMELSSPQSENGFNLKFPEKIIRSIIYLDSTIEMKTCQATKEFSELEVWNVRAVPGNQYELDKIEIFEAVYKAIKYKTGGSGYRKCDNNPKRPVILAGDFNAPRFEGPDGQVMTWAHKRSDNYYRWKAAEMNILKGLYEFGMVDVFRLLNGYENAQAYSHENNGTRFRFDHLFASEELGPINCYYDYSGFECSDHAPIIAEFEI